MCTDLSNTCLKCSKDCYFLAGTSVFGRPLCLECWDSFTVNLQDVEAVLAPIALEPHTKDESLLVEAVTALLLYIRKNKIGNSQN